MNEPSPPRRHDLDALRAFAMLLGIALHAALSFVPFPWVVQDRSQHAEFGLFVQAVHGFRMPLFFLLSGFFTAMLWRRRGLRGLISQRVKRILLPLGLGCATIVPLMWGVVVWAGSGTGTYGATSTDRDVWTAAAHGDLEAVERFVETGVDLDRADPAIRQSPLAWAVIGGHSDVVAHLLEAGANPSARYGDENTALHTAAFFGRVESAALLLEAGADVHARNVHGESPMDTMRHGRGTTEYIAGLLKVPIDYDDVAAGRERVREALEARGATSGLEQADPANPARGAGAQALRRLVLWLLLFPFFHHLWFLWFLCWLVAGFALVALVVRLVRLPAPPAWAIRSPLHWLWIVPLTLLPQMAMHQGGAAPGFGPDTSAGLLPLPHVLLYYAVFFGFGALYHGARDDAGRVGRRWWLQLPLALFVVLPIGLGLTSRLPWAVEFAGAEETRRLLAGLLQVLYAWLMVFGLMGLCRRVLARDRPWVRYLSDSSYWLYLAHLPLVIALQAVVRDWPLPAALKFTLLLAGATALLLLTYRYAVRYTWLGRLLNGERARPPP